jgi:glycosyltransferase involved in cell wall biosynthesis
LGDEIFFKESLRLYKYRQEVKLLQGLNEKEIQKITAAAYALVHPVLHQTFQPALSAMQCEVPVIISTGEAATEIFTDTVLYADPNNFENIARQMMLLFKDESSRSELISKAKRKITEYSIEKTTAGLWKAITIDASNS